MKTSVTTRFFLLAFSLLLCSRPVKASGNPDTLSYLQVDGKILNAGEGTDGNCRIELWASGHVVDSVILTGSKTKFKFVLLCNSYYTIRVAKKGFIDRLVCIDTSIPGGFNDEFFRFRFETSLIESSVARSLNTDLIDFPATIVHYQKDEDVFECNWKYTNGMKQDLYSNGSATAKR